MTDIKVKKCHAPDVVLINSCIWDITRWGPDGVNLYKRNMHKVMKLFKECLPTRTLVIYSTTLPISQSCKGAFLVKQVEFMKHSLRFEIMEGNLFAKQVVPTYGYNILDFHFYLRMQIHWRTSDGVHWKPVAVRHMTNLLLTHIALSWEMPLPRNFNGKLLNRIESEFQNALGYKRRVTSEKLYKPLMPPPTFFRPLRTRNKKNVRNNVNLSYKFDSIHSNSDPTRFQAERKQSRDYYNKNIRSNDCDQILDSLYDKENFEPFYDRSISLNYSLNVGMQHYNNDYLCLPTRDEYIIRRDWNVEPSDVFLNGERSFDQYQYRNSNKYECKNTYVPMRQCNSKRFRFRDMPY